MSKTAMLDGFHAFSDRQLEVIEASCDWAFVTDENFSIRFCHKCESATYDILPDNLIGLSFENFLPYLVRKKVMEELRQGDYNGKKAVECLYEDQFTGLSRLKATKQTGEESGYTITVHGFTRKGIGYIEKLLAKDACNNVEEQADLQLRQQELISKIAFKYAKNSETNIEELFSTTIETLGKFMGVDRCLVFKHDLAARTYSVLYEWHSPKVTANKGFLQNIPYNDDDEGFIQLTTRPYIAVDDTFQFEGEAYKVQRDSGVHAFVDLPILCNGKFWGFLGADYGDGPHYWTESEFHMLQTIGSIMSSAVEKREIQDRLEAATMQANQASSAKTDFLSRMSHEIRTPMNAIIGMREIAKKSTDVERIQYCLTKIDQASHQLLGIINDILDLSKIESGKMQINITEFDFESLLQSTYNVIQPRIDEKGIEFYFNGESGFSDYVLSDELRLSQVILNLLSNAAKFTPEGGRITLKSRFFKKDGNDFLRVSVKDTGIGISKESQARLFQAFEQADGGITRKYGGTGLGLPICKSIVELMGGRIFLTSEEGKGSTFTFEVPIAFGGKIAEKKRILPESDTRILVVDDNPDVLESCKDIIEGFKITCDTVDSGKGAIELLKKQNNKPYNIIFVDWMMPEMNGIETAKKIKDFVPPDTIVIMISSADWVDMKDDAIEIGVTHYLPKPLLPSALFDTIVELLSNEQSRIKQQNATEEFCWDNKSILIAEDIEINREIVYTLLEPTNVKIEFAENGLVAVEKYMAHPDLYDVILMDIQMPVMDGFEATGKIRASKYDNAATIPILAMTANAFSKDVEDCLSAGMNGHISKPVDIAELMEKLNAYLGS